MEENAADSKQEKRSGVSRREFIVGTVGGVVVGAVVGAAAGSLGFPKTITQTATQTQTATVTSVSTTTASTLPTSWDLTADLIVIGGGAAGLCAAVAASNLGASVIVVEMNYDVGGHAIVSGGTVDLGGGNAAQQLGGITDSVVSVFNDLTSPITYVPGKVYPGSGLEWAPFNNYGSSYNTHWYAGPFQDRAMTWIFAQNNVAAFNFLVANGVQFSDMIPGTKPSTSHFASASGTARSNTPMWNGSTSNPPSAASPVGNVGVGYIRPLEATARSKGVKFLLNYRMTTIYRQQPSSGAVVGVSASYTGGRFLPGSSTSLQPYATQGNISLTQATVNIKANKGVMVATGGSSSNVDRRMRFDPRMTDVYQVGGDPYAFQTGDGEVAAQKIGASLWATGNETSENGRETAKSGYIGCQYGYGSIHFVPASPIFPLARAGGLSVSNYQDVIEVNMAGARFADETDSSYCWMDAAMNVNSASKPPLFAAGPCWAIFDSAAVNREKWTLGSPNTDPLYFFQGNDIPSLVQGINTNTYQTTPMDPNALQATITRYNGFVDAGVDSDFGKPKPLYKINTPPYYAAFDTPVIHDWLTGLRTDYSGRVLDLDANPIPGLFAAGESIGGMCMHGLARCTVFGVLAGQNAANGSSTTTISSTLSPVPATTTTTKSS